MTEADYLKAIKIQSRAVIPIAKALAKEMGKERAYALIGDAVSEAYGEYVAVQLEEKARVSHPRASSNPYGVEVIVKDTDTEFGVDVHRCPYADYFQSIGEEEIGALMTCQLDYSIERRLRPDWEFSRAETLMRGDDRCSFRGWRPKSPRFHSLVSC